LCTFGRVIAAAMKLDERARHRWGQSQRATTLLLLVWFVVTFGVVFFARELSMTVFGWPFSFWVAAQGILILYVVLVWVYARWMHRLDVENHLAGSD
jgi:putative solute:sodium symporter small subunit